MGARPNYVTIQSLLRLGTKYGMDDLRARAMDYFGALLCPSDVYGWDAFKANPSVEYEPADIISMANLASDLSLHSHRARALYRCCQLPSNDIVEGILHSRGAVVRLSPANVAICIDARQQLIVAKLSVTAYVISQFKSNLCKDTSCVARRTRLTQCSLIEPCLPDANPLEPPDIWLSNSSSRVPAGVFCGSCRSRVVTQINSQRSGALLTLDTHLYVCQSCVFLSH